MDKQISVGRYAQMLKEYMEDNNPQMFQQMKEAGTLDEYVSEREGEFLNQVKYNQEKGMSLDQAQEAAWEVLMQLPGTPERS